MGERRVHSFYRIATAFPPPPDDYRTHRAKRGDPPPRLPESLIRSWNDGLSAFDTEAAAIAQAIGARGRLGRLVVRFDIPADVGITWEQTGGNPHHFDLFGNHDELARYLTDQLTEVELPGAREGRARR